MILKKDNLQAKAKTGMLERIEKGGKIPRESRGGSPVDRSLNAFSKIDREKFVRRRLRSWKFARPLINPREVSCLSTSAAYTWPCSRQLPWRCTGSFGDRHHDPGDNTTLSSSVLVSNRASKYDEAKTPNRPVLAQPSLRCVTYRAIVLVVIVVEGYPPPPPPIFPPSFPPLLAFRHHFLHFLAPVSSLELFDY